MSKSKLVRRILNYKIEKCEICEYDEYPKILVIHHKDKNRKNNLKENLQVLCPNCHSVQHMNDKRIGYTKGRKASLETRKKLSLACKGRKPWNKGLKTGIRAKNWGGILKNCMNCNIRYTVSPSHNIPTKRESKFCSRKCKDQFMVFGKKRK